MTSEPFGMLGIEIASMLDQGGQALLAMRDQVNFTSVAAIYQYDPDIDAMQMTTIIKSPGGTGNGSTDWFGAGLAISATSATLVIHF